MRSSPPAFKIRDARTSRSRRGRPVSAREQFAGHMNSPSASRTCVSQAARKKRFLEEQGGEARLKEPECTADLNINSTRQHRQAPTSPSRRTAHGPSQPPHGCHPLASPTRVRPARRVRRPLWRPAQGVAEPDRCRAAPRPGRRRGPSPRSARRTPSVIDLHGRAGLWPPSRPAVAAPELQGPQPFFASGQAGPAAHTSKTRQGEDALKIAAEISRKFKQSRVRAVRNLAILNGKFQNSDTLS